MTRRTRKISALREGADASPEAISERLANAARELFAYFGVEKTNIEDITKKVGLSRSSFYTYFTDKADLVDRITYEESLKLNADIRSRLTRRLSFEDQITEFLLMAVRGSFANPYLSKIMEDSEYVSNCTAPDSVMYRMHQDLWGRFFRNAGASGKLAPHLKLDDVLGWLMLSQDMLLIRLRATQQSDDEVREFIRNFVVPPLTCRRPESTGITPSSPGHPQVRRLPITRSPRLRQPTKPPSV